MREKELATKQHKLQQSIDKAKQELTELPAAYEKKVERGVAKRLQEAKQSASLGKTQAGVELTLQRALTDHTDKLASDLNTIESQICFLNQHNLVEAKLAERRQELSALLKDPLECVPEGPDQAKEAKRLELDLSQQINELEGDLAELPPVAPVEIERLAQSAARLSDSKQAAETFKDQLVHAARRWVQDPAAKASRQSMLVWCEVLRLHSLELGLLTITESEWVRRYGSSKGFGAFDLDNDGEWMA